MKQGPSILRAGLIFAVLAFASPGSRAAEAADAAVKYSGNVKITQRGPAGEPLAATLKTADGKTFDLVMDEKGKSLAGVMAGQNPEIFGVAEENALRVIGYTDERVNAGHEFWRRMRCLACVVLPATVNAVAPQNLRGATVVTGRDFSYKRRFLVWTRDAQFLWVAADNEIFQFDLAQRRLVRRLGKADGLPDPLIYQLVSDGRTLWIVHRGGVAAAVVADGRVKDLPKLSCRFARAALGDGEVWVIADTGTFRFKSPDDTPVTLPALPTAGRIAKAVENGIWPPHWQRRTSLFITSPAAIDGRLYAGSYGDIYELADGTWRRVVEGGFEQAARNGRLWFLNAKGLNAYDPKGGKIEALEPPEEVRGRYTQLLATDTAVWLAAEPVPGAGGSAPTGGGLAKYDLATHAWQSWTQINNRPARPLACLAENEGTVWAVAMEGKYITKSAHPGMTTTHRQDFQPTEFCLHRCDPKSGQWESLPLPITELDRRLICGQDGCYAPDAIVPQFIDSLSVGTNRVFAVTRLVPKQFFGGYWPSIGQVASRDGGAWTAKFDHHPEQLDLQGEQPMVLDISSGQLTAIGSSLKDQLWEAIGNDLTLGLFAAAGTHWAITESAVACFDEAAGAWKKLVASEFRWYWHATALLDDGRYVYIGSDRGLLCRLDTETATFETQATFSNRSVTRIVKNSAGEIMAASRPAPLGALPVQLAVDTLKTLEGEAARFDGRGWAVAKAADLPADGPAPAWHFERLEPKPVGHNDKTQGNFLCESAPGSAQSTPRYYLKEAFFPVFLSKSSDGRRMWIATYTGLTRLDFPPTTDK